MLPDAPLFSIIIPFKAPGPYLAESLPHLLALLEPSFEVILLPDAPMDVSAWTDDPRVRAVPTGAVSPALKRDRGAEVSLGEYLAFIDDDTLRRIVDGHPRERILFGSDYPLFDPGDEIVRLRKRLSLRDAELERILSNGAVLFESHE